MITMIAENGVTFKELEKNIFAWAKKVKDKSTCFQLDLFHTMAGY